MSVEEKENNLAVLKEMTARSPNGFMKTLMQKKDFGFLRVWVSEMTPKLSSPEFSWKTRVYWVLNGMTDFPKCEICGGEIKSNVVSVTCGYKTRTCCRKCRYELQVRTTKITCLERYGVESNLQTPEFKEKSEKTCLEKYSVTRTARIPGSAEKRKATCLERYGVETPAESPETLAKTRITCLERYGETSFSKTQAFIEKTNATCMEKYGVMFPGQSENAKNTRKETCLERYGVDSYSKTDEFLEKSRATCLERYGVESVLQSGSKSREKAKATRAERYGDENWNNREKARTTCLDRYGSETPSGNPSVMKAMAEGHIRNNYRTLCENVHVVPMFSEDEYLSKTPDTVFRWKCLDCGNEFETKINWNYYKDHPLKTVARCLTCRPVGMSGTSYEEKAFVETIRGVYDGEIIERARILEDGTDRRSWKEIDCYLPGLKLGFEYDGIYFHQLRDGEDCSHRHLMKTMLAEKQGIRLVHVRSDEWLGDKDRLLREYMSMIRGEFRISGFSADMLEVDRSVYNKCVDIPGYAAIGETGPELFEFWHAGRKYVYEDCGKLLYKKKGV